MNTNNYWTITDPANTPTSELIKQCRELFEMYVYDEENIDTQFPAPEKETTRYFHKTIEPDTETLGLSVKETLKKGITQEMGITLRERIIMGIQYFKETGNHLDIKGVTFCSGSRCAGGGVPDVGLDSDGEVSVRWYNVGYCSSDYGIRVAVSLDTLSSEPLKINDKELSFHDHITCLKAIVKDKNNRIETLENKLIKITNKAEELLELISNQ